MKARIALSRISMGFLLLMGSVGTFATLVPALGPTCNKAYADHLEAQDYCYRFPIDVTTATGVTITNQAVRVPVRPSNLVATRYLSPYAWDLRPTSSGLDQREATAQDMAQVNASWWLLIPSQAAETTARFYMYMGNPEAERNQGFIFDGGDDLVSVPDAEAPLADVTDDFSLSVIAQTPATHASSTPGWFAGKYDVGGSDGYRLGTYDDGGTKYVRAQVDTATLDVEWDGENTEIAMTFVAPTLTIFFNGVSQDTSNTGLGGVTSNTADVEIGEDYIGLVRQATLVGSISTTNDVIYRFNFDPVDIAQVTPAGGAADATGNYTGTVADVGPNGYDADYVITRLDADDVTVVVGPIASTTANPVINIPQQIGNVLGDITPGALDGPSGANLRIPFMAPMVTLQQNLDFPAQPFWLLILGILGGLFAVIVYRFIPAWPISAGTVGLFLLFGVVAGVLAWWWVAAYGLLSFAAYSLLEFRR